MSIFSGLSSFFPGLSVLPALPNIINGITHAGTTLNGSLDGIASNAGTIGGSAAGGSGILATISDLFLRATIIILGFIFVAVGLSMFKNSNTTLSLPESDSKGKIDGDLKKLVKREAKLNAK